MNCLLINNLLTKDSDVRSKLWKDEHIHLSSLDFCDHAYTSSDNINSLSRNELFINAAFYLQNPSSLLPVVALDPKPGDEVLDIASAPGGKTFHMACRMQNEGKIIANDLSHTRINKMTHLLNKYGVKNVDFTSFPGQILWQKYKNFFDKILVDAPCTMQGTDTPSTDSPKKMSYVQKSLLRSAMACCKPGGIVVYSTCTNTIEENEEVIDSILSKEAGVCELLEVKFPKTVARAISEATNSKGKKISYDTSKTFRVMKNETFEGFFIAKLKKLDVASKAKHH